MSASGTGSVDRRHLLRAGAAGALLGAAGCGGGGAGGPAVHTQQRVQWRLASSFPASLDTIYGASQVLAERVAAMSEERFTIRLHQAGELVPALQVLDAVQQGSAQVGQTCGYYYTGKNPALAYDTCVPFGLTARQQNGWLFEGGGLELVRALYADFGVISFPSGNTGAQMGGWFRRPVNSLQDLKGLKMRIPGLGGKVMDTLGATVQVLSGGEIYPALERGAIDATEWVGPYDDEKLGFHKVARHYHYPGWWEPGPSMSFLVNRSSWDGLPPSYREIFVAASAEAGLAMQTRYDAKNPPALERLRATGIAIAPFPPDVLVGSRAAAEALLEDQAAADAGYRKVHEHWKAFRKGAFEWFATAELAYQNAAFGP
jgi:TRAP-type mannitol/chloroaromatic compound transport system substrate-binding protein